MALIIFEATNQLRPIHLPLFDIQYNLQSIEIQYKALLFNIINSFANKKINMQMQNLCKQTFEQIYSQEITNLTIISSKISPRIAHFCQKILSVLSGNILQMPLFNWTYNSGNQDIKELCGKILNGQNIYICSDCSVKSNSCFCEDCFKDVDHSNHQTKSYKASGGAYCDCGDQSQLKQTAFCKNHGINKLLQAPKMNEQQINIFKMELQFLFYIYFLMQKGETLLLRKINYGTELYNFLIKIVEKNYDARSHLVQILSSEITFDCFNLQKGKPRKIIEYIFCRNGNQNFWGIPKFLDLVKKILNVSSFKKLIIQNYFRHIISHDWNQKSFCVPNLSQIVFIHSNIILELIDQKKIEPFQLKCYEYKSYQAMKTGYKKMFQDLETISQRQGQFPAYTQWHLSKVNIIQFGNYRQFIFQSSTYAQLDTLLIRIFQKFVKVINQNKNLLVKLIKDLLIYVANVHQKFNKSLAQELMLALLLLAYCQGNTMKLFSCEFCQNLRNEMNFSEAEFSLNVKKMILKGPKLVTQYLMSSQPNNAIGTIIQGQIYDLSLIYQRILIFLNHYYAQRNQQNYYGVSYLKEILSTSKQKITIPLLTFLTRLSVATCLNYYQISFASKIGIVKQHQINLFYKRLLASFNTIGISQFSNVVNKLLPSSSISIGNFINYDTVKKQNCIYLKENNFYGLPLIFFEDFFANFKSYLDKYRFNPFESDEILCDSSIYEIKILNEEMITTIINVVESNIQYTLNYLNRQFDGKYIYQAIKALILTYFFTNSQSIKNFMIKLSKQANRYNLNQQTMNKIEGLLNYQNKISKKQQLKLKLTQSLLLKSQSISQNCKKMVQRIIKLFETDNLNQLLIFEDQQNLSDLFDQKPALFSFQYKIKRNEMNYICSKTQTKFFECLDCSLNANSIFCYDCFIACDHQGHAFFEFSIKTGLCDCGNLQLVKQSGCCSKHKNPVIELTQIETEIYSKFMSEMKMAFYIYFFILENSSLFSLTNRRQYVNWLFSLLTQISLKSYQSKLMVIDLLSAKFDSDYPTLKIFQKAETIIEMLFKLHSTSIGLTQFMRLCEKLIGVKSFRTKILLSYILKKERLSQSFYQQHPLNYLCNQFFNFANQIAGIYQQYDINQKNNFLSESQMISYYKSKYQNFQIINKVQNPINFHKIYLKKTNIVDFGGYRIWSKYLKSTNLNESCLSALLPFIRSLKEDYECIIKCLKQLFQFLTKPDLSDCSQIQECMFALILEAYCDGNISKLESKQFCLNLFNQICPSQSEVVSKLRILSSNFFSKIQVHFEKMNQQSQFLSKNTYNELFLIYNKSLIIIFNQYLQFSEITKQYRLSLITRPEQQVYQIILNLLNFIIMVGYINLYELKIANDLKINKQNHIIAFYRSLLATFSNFNALQFRKTASQAILNTQALENFCDNQVTIIGNRLKLKSQSQPLYNFIYEYYLGDIFAQSSQKIFFPINSLSHIKLLINIEIINEQFISYIISLAQVYRKSETKEDDELIKCNSLIKKLIPVYFLTKSLILKNYFRLLLDQNTLFNHIFEPQICSHLSLIVNEKQNFEQYETKTKLQIETKSREKKQKLLSKRLEKQKDLKIKQSKLLQIFEQQVKQEKVKQQILCFICKIQKNEQEFLNYPVTVELSNLIEKDVLNIQQKHLVFTTCNHPIHLSCFQKTQNRNKRLNCNVCKSKYNLHVPILSQSGISKQQIKIKFDQFKNEVQRVLYQPKQNKEQADIFANYQSLLFNSLIREVAYSGYYQFQFFESKQYIIYKQINFLLKNIMEVNENKVIQTEIKNQEQKESKKIEYNQLISYQFIANKLKDQKLLMPQFYGESNESLENIKNLSNFFENFWKNNLQGMKIYRKEGLFYKEFYIAKLPKEIQELRNNICVCKDCNFFTTKTLICLICGWKSCRNCSQALKSHSKNQHQSMNIYIKASTGQLTYFYQGLSFQNPSIYYDIFGQPFSQQVILRRKKFKLSNIEINNIIKQIMQYGIRQIIYKENY